jgi:hypothetical protein
LLALTHADLPWLSRTPPPPRQFTASPAHVALKVYIANVCVKCFRCSRRVLQVFHKGVAKVDQDVAYVAMAIHVCCKCLFKMFHLLPTYVACVLSTCCICCSDHTDTLQVYDPNVSSTLDVCCRKCFHVANISRAGTSSPLRWRQSPCALSKAGLGGPHDKQAHAAGNTAQQSR